MLLGVHHWHPLLHGLHLSPQLQLPFLLFADFLEIFSSALCIFFFLEVGFFLFHSNRHGEPSSLVKLIWSLIVFLSYTHDNPLGIGTMDMKHSDCHSSGNGAVFVKRFVEDWLLTSLNIGNLLKINDNWGRLSHRLRIFCCFLSLCLKNN